jgi:DNA-binding beta-propeller fold protein YncE
LASGAWDNTVRLWDVESGQHKATLQGAGQVNAAAFSSDGRALATAEINTVRLWDVKTGKVSTELFVKGGARSVSFSPNGKHLVVGDEDRNTRVMALADGLDPVTAPPPPGPSAKRFTNPEGTLAADVYGNTVVLLDLTLAERDRAERIALEPGNRVFHHHQQAAQAEKEENWFAAQFHLGRLLEDKPGDADLLKRRDAAREKLKPPTPMEPLPRP